MYPLTNITFSFFTANYVFWLEIEGDGFPFLSKCWPRSLPSPQTPDQTRDITPESADNLGKTGAAHFHQQLDLFSAILQSCVQCSFIFKLHLNQKIICWTYNLISSPVSSKASLTMLPIIIRNKYSQYCEWSEHSINIVCKLKMCVFCHGKFCTENPRFWDVTLHLVQSQSVLLPYHKMCVLEKWNRTKDGCGNFS